MSNINSCFTLNNEVVYSTLIHFTVSEIEKIFFEGFVTVGFNKINIIKVKNYRLGLFKTADSCIYLETSESALVKSSSKCETFFSTIIDANNYTIKVLKQVETEKTDSTHNLIHNLRTLNARSLHELEYILPKFTSGISQETNTLITKHLRNNLDKTVSGLIKVYKSTQVMANEFSIFEKTSLQKENISLSTESHKVHKFLMSVLYAYFPYFLEKSVYISVSPSDLKFCVDYETICSVLHSFFENAVKYSKSGTEIKISFSLDQNFVGINIDMISVEIKPDEITNLSSKGFRGAMAKKMAKQGEGLGWGIMLDYLMLNKGSLTVIPNFETVKLNSKGDLKYQQNTFEIKLPSCPSNKIAA